MKLPSPSPLAEQWMLDPEVVFLNQGSFGACPRHVFEARQRYLAQAEAEPVRFLVREGWELLDRSRSKLGGLVNAQPADIVFVPNVTTAVATIASNLDLQPGDEVLANAHEYSACLAIMERATARAGAKLVRAPLPFPMSSADEIIEAIMAGVSERTTWCLLSHVTSASGLILPVAEIVARLRERGVETIVDGAHAPGFCDVDILQVDPAFYTANCHKWLCSPRASGFLYVRPDLQEGFRPLALSVHTNHPRPDRSFLLTEFDYVGTQDHSASFCIADAIDFVPSLVGGDWVAVAERNRSLCLRARDLLCERLGIERPAPDAMLGSMATIPLPPHDPEQMARLSQRPTAYHDALQDRLVDVHKIQLPVGTLPVRGGPPTRFFRISCQLYNALEQYEYLADALVQELERERGL